MKRKPIKTTAPGLFRNITMDEILDSIPDTADVVEPVVPAINSMVLDYLPTSKEQAISSRDLRAKTGLTFRELKAIITALRYVHPICAQETGGGGYWLAQTPEDIEAFVKMIERRKAGYEKTIEVMKGHLLEM